MTQPYGKSFKVSGITLEESLELFLNVEIEIHSFDSGYESYTSNHDDPRFSDPGEGEESDYTVYLVSEKLDTNGKNIRLDITEFLTQDDFDYLDEKVSEYAREYAQAQYEDAMIDKYEELLAYHDSVYY